MQDDLHKACRVGDLETIKEAYYKNQDKLNEKDIKLGWTPVYRTVVNANLEGSQFLISKGADANIKNNLGETALH